MSSIKKSKSTKISILLKSANNAHNRGNAGLLPQIEASIRIMLAHKQI